MRPVMIMGRIAGRAPAADYRSGRACWSICLSSTTRLALLPLHRTDEFDGADIAVWAGDREVVHADLGVVVVLVDRAARSDLLPVLRLPDCALGPAVLHHVEPWRGYLPCWAVGSSTALSSLGRLVARGRPILAL